MITQRQARNYIQALINQKQQKIAELKKEVRILQTELYFAGLPDSVIEEIIREAYDAKEDMD